MDRLGRNGVVLLLALGVAVAELVFLVRDSGQSPFGAKPTPLDTWRPPTDPPAPLTNPPAPPPIESEWPSLDASAAEREPTLIVDAAATESAVPIGVIDFKEWITEQACTNARNMEKARNWEHNPTIRRVLEQEKARCLAGGGHW
jgi:hypothetical protein